MSGTRWNKQQIHVYTFELSPRNQYISSSGTVTTITFSTLSQQTMYTCANDIKGFCELDPPFSKQNIFSYLQIPFVYCQEKKSHILLHNLASSFAWVSYLKNKFNFTFFCPVNKFLSTVYHTKLSSFCQWKNTSLY